MDGDIFTHTSNRKRIYALASWTGVFRARGWYYRRTDHDEEWRGPYSSEMSVCLMVARALCREVKKRDGLPS